MYVTRPAERKTVDLFRFQVRFGIDRDDHRSSVAVPQVRRRGVSRRSLRSRLGSEETVEEEENDAGPVDRRPTTPSNDAERSRRSAVDASTCFSEFSFEEFDEKEIDGASGVTLGEHQRSDVGEEENQNGENLSRTKKVDEKQNEETPRTTEHQQ